MSHLQNLNRETVMEKSWTLLYLLNQQSEEIPLDLLCIQYGLLEEIPQTGNVNMRRTATPNTLHT